MTSGRKPLGERAMTDAERQRKRRERLRAEAAAQEPSDLSPEDDEDINPYSDFGLMRNEIEWTRSELRAWASIFDKRGGKEIAGILRGILTHWGRMPQAEDPDTFCVAHPAWTEKTEFEDDDEEGAAT
jgi:hypothetical protein